MTKQQIYLSSCKLMWCIKINKF